MKEDRFIPFLDNDLLIKSKLDGLLGQFFLTYSQIVRSIELGNIDNALDLVKYCHNDLRQLSFFLKKYNKIFKEKK